MKIWQAILITILIIIVAFLLRLGYLFFIVGVLPSAIWGYLDSRKIGVEKYESTGFSKINKPYIVFLGMLVIWIFFFPWYLSYRSKIQRGEAKLKKTA